MGDYWLTFLEIAVAIGILLLYLSARKTFSAEDVRRTMITENERLAGAIKRLADEFEARVQLATEALDAAIERAEEAARRLDQLSRHAQLDHERSSPPQASLAPSSQTTPAEHKHKQVIALAEQGMSIESIARQVELGTGEVELVLNISREGQNRASYIPKESK